MWTVQGELDTTLAELALPEKQIVRLDETKAKDIIRIIMKMYVSGNPRSWWLALKLPFTSFSYDYASGQLGRHMKLKNKCYWIPETGANDLPVYETTIETIKLIMLNCTHFEYYISDINFEKLLIANDHGEIIVSSKRQSTV